LSLGVGQDALRVLLSGFGHLESPFLVQPLKGASYFQEGSAFPKAIS